MQSSFTSLLEIRQVLKHFIASYFGFSFECFFCLIWFCYLVGMSNFASSQKTVWFLTAADKHYFLSLVTSSPTVFLWILSPGKSCITKVALEDCNLVEEFKAVTCENCRKVREDIRMCLCFSLYVVIFWEFLMIKDYEND